MNKSKTSTDIAIIGLACRFPGANTPQEYWRNLCDGVESITFFSDDALLEAGVDPALLEDPYYVKAAPILKNIDEFDAAFFGYSPKDATLMDPQQRLFLEVAWETFEDAGYDPVTYPGPVGVISGGGGVVTSYLLANLHHADLPGQTASLQHINNDKDFLSTRVSYKLDLTGPSLTVATACSTTTVAAHLACQNLKLDEAQMMLVGGSVVRVPHISGYLAERRNLNSMDGHCRPFDAEGAGTIFGSGVGAVLLKRMDDALADCDHIYAVIKGTAINNDGAGKTSYTAPSLGGQSKAVSDALKVAGVAPESVGYVECHSTGTTVGDPLEIQALGRAFETDHHQYCAVGSLKANIGHPEQSAGIVGLIKTALILHHKKIPPSINFTSPNPNIDFAASPFFVNTELRDFPNGGTPRRVGVNSLGIGGTNAFAVLEEAPALPTNGSRATDSSSHLVTLSAKSAPALVARVEQLLGWLETNPDASIADVCYTTNVSRSQFAFRFAAVATSITELKSELETFLKRAPDQGSELQRTKDGAIAFMFSGQGGQHAGMAAELYRSQPRFREAIDRCHELARPYLDEGLREVIFSQNENSLVNRTDYTQPALFAIEYALTELLKSWGVTPSAVIGYSLGELVAACVAGTTTLEDMIRLITTRGALMQTLPSGGAMAAVFAEESVVRGLIDALAPEVTIAASNGPMNTVISGEKEDLARLGQELERQEIAYTELRISNAFHSPRTEPILADFERVAGELEYREPQVPLVSNLTGKLMTDAPGKTYWSRHIREAVRFGDGMTTLSALECQTYLEVGPHPTLVPMAQMCLGAESSAVSWVTSLIRENPDSDSIAKMLRGLYLAGHTIDWLAVHAASPKRRIPLPTYPFQRKRYWLEGAPAGTTLSPQSSTIRSHPLLGTRVESTTKGARYRAQYGVQQLEYFSDHKIAGTVVMPTTAVLEAATKAGRELLRTSRISLESVLHHEPMPLGNGENRLVEVQVVSHMPGAATFQLSSSTTENEEDWRTHVTGTLRTQTEQPSWPDFESNPIKARCQQTVAIDQLYHWLDGLGLGYGPGFRGIEELHLGDGEALTKVRLPDGLPRDQYLMHPALLDACLHVYPAILGEAAGTRKNGTAYACLPVGVQGYRCYQEQTDEVWVHSVCRQIDEGGTSVIDFRIYDLTNRPVAELEGVSVRLLPLTIMQARTTESEPDMLYRVQWHERSRGDFPGDEEKASWIIFADEKAEVGTKLAAELVKLGHHADLVFQGQQFAQTGDHRWAVDQREPEDFIRLFKQHAGVEPLPCRGIVYLWGLDAPDMEGLTLDELQRGTELTSRPALSIVQALGETRAEPGGQRRLWFVTSNTQRPQPNRQRVEPIQAPLWGLGRTVALEYPNFWGGLIDLQIDTDRRLDMTDLVRELLKPDGETQIAIRGHRRYVARLEKHELGNDTRGPQIHADATYLITGGLGMIGLNVAKWLVDQGARHLVLTGRTANDETTRDLLRTFGDTSLDIRVMSADVSRESDVRRIVDMIAEKMPPLKGVVHSAGVLDDGILAQLTWDRFLNTLAPKVYGSWLLHEHTKSLELDFFVLKSSLLSLLGSAGQGNYTASSAFLDSLTGHRRATGLPATAMNWSAWSEGGLANKSGGRGEAMWASLGVEWISPALGLQIFDQLMRFDLDHIAVAITDWTTYVGQLGRTPPFFAKVLDSVSGPVSPPTPPVSQPGESKGNGDGRPRLLATLQTHVMQELGFSETIDPSQPLNELGLDSLMSVSLANRLEAEFGITIPVALLIQGPSLDQLADGVLQPLQGDFADEDRSQSATTASVTTPGAVAEKSPLPQAVKTPHGDGRAALLETLQSHVMAELGFSEPIDPAQPLNELGLDSLMSVSLANRLESAFGVPVPVALLIQGPSLDQLVDGILGTNLGNVVDDNRDRPTNGGSLTTPTVVPEPLPSTQPPPLGSNGDGRAALMDTVQTHVMAELGFDERIDPSQPLNEIGLDSLIAVSLANHLESALGVQIPVALLIQGPSLNQLVDGQLSALVENFTVDDQHNPGDGGTVTTPTAPPPADIVHHPQLPTNGNGGASRRQPSEPGPVIPARPGNGGLPTVTAVEPILQHNSGSWLISPRPNPNAAFRLFCFPYAGGGVVSFREWPPLLDESIEVVAIEPPGRGTRINEDAIDSLSDFVDALLPELTAKLDKPSAFFGHCLGGLTMFETFKALSPRHANNIKHLFVCGVRAPHRLQKSGVFEEKLYYKMLLHPDFDPVNPPYNQTDEVFADFVREFHVDAANEMTDVPELRELLFPTVRAEFEMASNYRHRKVSPFDIPITCFLGDGDPWVSEDDALGWEHFTRSEFRNHVRRGSHFLMADDRHFVVDKINSELHDWLS